ncbi:MAG: hypothetical protein PGN24_05080 [Microbacterium arborescens]
MEQITAFTEAHLSFLREDGRYAVTDVDERPGTPDCVVVWASDRLSLRFVTDRGQLFLDVRPAPSTTARDWSSIDLVRRLFTGERKRSSVLDADYAAFLREHMAEIEDRFSPDRWPATRAELAELRRIRSREMFG